MDAPLPSAMPAAHRPPTAIVVLGPSGCGKTTVGRLLAERLGATFADADDYHSAANRAKMARGDGLTDADRAPWLATLAALLAAAPAQPGGRLVLACSALRVAYRQTLRQAVPVGQFAGIALLVERTALAHRLCTRAGHYAGEALLASQLAAFETPDAAHEPDILCLAVGDATLPADLVQQADAWLARRA